MDRFQINHSCRVKGSLHCLDFHFNLPMLKRFPQGEEKSDEDDDDDLDLEALRAAALNSMKAKQQKQAQVKLSLTLSHRLQ